MPFTRKLLKSLGLSDEQIEAVIEAHTDVTDAQKATIADLAEKANKVDELQKKLSAIDTSEDWKGKFEAKEKELTEYKASVESKERESAVKAAYRKLLAEEHIGERQLDAVVRATDFKGMSLDKDGNLEGLDKLKADIKDNWGGFITTTETRGANVPTPPAGGAPAGANPRAAELARLHHEQRYGKPTSAQSAEPKAE